MQQLLTATELPTKTTSDPKHRTSVPTAGMIEPQLEITPVTGGRALALRGTGPKRSWIVSAARVTVSAPARTASIPAKTAKPHPWTAEMVSR